MEMFSSEEKEQILKMAQDAASRIKREISISTSSREMVAAIDLVISELMERIAEIAATNAFKAKGREYVRAMTIATIDRILKLE